MSDVVPAVQGLLDAIRRAQQALDVIANPCAKCDENGEDETCPFFEQHEAAAEANLELDRALAAWAERKLLEDDPMARKIVRSWTGNHIEEDQRNTLRYLAAHLGLTRPVPATPTDDDFLATVDDGPDCRDGVHRPHCRKYVPPSPADLGRATAATPAIPETYHDIPAPDLGHRERREARCEPVFSDELIASAMVDKQPPGSAEVAPGVYATPATRMEPGPDKCPACCSTYLTTGECSHYKARCARCKLEKRPADLSIERLCFECGVQRSREMTAEFECWGDAEESRERDLLPGQRCVGEVDHREADRRFNRREMGHRFNRLADSQWKLAGEDSRCPYVAPAAPPPSVTPPGDGPQCNCPRLRDTESAGHAKECPRWLRASFPPGALDAIAADLSHQPCGLTGRSCGAIDCPMGAPETATAMLVTGNPPTCRACECIMIPDGDGLRCVNCGNRGAPGSTARSLSERVLEIQCPVHESGVGEACMDNTMRTDPFVCLARIRAAEATPGTAEAPRKDRP